MFFSCLKKVIIFLILIITVSSCYEETVHVKNNIETNEKVNHWIYSTMSTYYYWNQDIKNLKLNYELSPEDFFNSLLHKDDKFSWIYNGQQEHINQMHGNRKNYGFEYALSYADESKSSLIGIVLYVHQGSKADNKGIKRGDIFTKINNVIIEKDNYESLLTLEECEFSFFRLNNGYNNEFVEKIRSEEIKVNPILVSKIIETNNLKTAYFCYNMFIADNGDESEQYKKDLLNCFEKYKQENIKELVLDLRYNPGGLIDLAVLISSLIVPDVDTARVALRFEYNEKLNQVYSNQGNNRELNFVSLPSGYIGRNLNRVFIITGSSTASASEAVINILKPYMEVILVGDKTYGKNYASSMFIDNYNLGNTWVIQPIILKVFNSINKSDYENGFIPNYTINEFSSLLVELGDTSEPLLKFTLEIIEGKHNSFTSKSLKEKTSEIFIYSYDKDIQATDIVKHVVR